MSHPSPTILALDFDGVICDGLIEYFQTTKRTYEKIWNEEKPVSDEIEPAFHRLRTVIETGWEMPILLRAIILGIAEEKILYSWLTVANQIVESEGLDKKNLSKQLDTVRDEWIASDLESWLVLHRFYPGVIQRIRQILASSTKFYIVTTKEGRFVKQLFQQQKIELPENTIFGKEYKRPKYETLRELLEINAEAPENLWFVEDRLEALELVRQQADLQAVKLYLADWGYNTQQTRDSLRDRQDIKILSLERFEQDFSTWD
ncbi:MAG: HAD family hydrolase [Hydrococcus sp. Prado102]|nr:HAD family hydrolase [Hydrococcus sp. Prado102]